LVLPFLPVVAFQLVDQEADLLVAPLLTDAMEIDQGGIF
jgi:hypothetical protein